MANIDMRICDNNGVWSVVCPLCGATVLDKLENQRAAFWNVSIILTHTCKETSNDPNVSSVATV